MRKTMGVLAALLGLWAPWAQAQVAVPELTPAAVRVYDSIFPIVPSNNVVPENPAAMQWGTPSRIGGGVLRGKKGDAGLGDSSSASGSFGGLRLVGQRFALGLETTSYKVQFPNVPQMEKKQTGGALSFSWPATLAFGLGTQKATLTNVPGLPQTLDISGPVAGVSWRLGERFFLGGAYGKERFTPTSVPNSPSLDRTHYMAGLALRGGGRVIWRVEVDTFHHDDLIDSFGVVKLPGYDLNQGSLEAILGSWLFGGTGYAIKGSASGARISGYSADFGYAPLGGLTITWRYEHSETKDPFGTLISKEAVNNAAIAWQF